MAVCFLVSAFKSFLADIPIGHQLNYQRLSIISLREENLLCHDMNITPESPIPLAYYDTDSINGFSATMTRLRLAPQHPERHLPIGSIW